MLRQLSIIFGCLAFGELIILLTGIEFPASIVGMLLLTTLLQLKIIKLEWVKPASNILTKNIGLFFVPAGVSIIEYLGIVKDALIPIIVACVISTILVILFTGWSFNIIRKLHLKIRKRQ